MVDKAALMAVGSKEDRDVSVLSVEEEVVGVLELVVKPPLSRGLGTRGRATKGNLPPQPLISLTKINLVWKSAQTLRASPNVV